METQDTNDSLKAMGYDLKYASLDPGNDYRQATWSVEITRWGASYTTTYFKGPGHRRKAPRSPLNPYRDRAPTTEPIPPTLAEVMCALLIDAETVRYGETFEGWCEDMGYDTDSKKVEQMFLACRESFFGLLRLGVGDFPALYRLVENE